MIRPIIVDVKWDVKKGYSVYSEVWTHRLVHWISTGIVKRGDIMVWRGGLSGWTRPEDLSELLPFFRQWEARRRPKKKKKVLIRRKKEIKSILVVDDEPDTCLLLKSLLGDKYEVSTVTTGREGIRHIKKNKPDLTFLDLRLRDMDGLTVLSRIKKASPSTIVSMISAYGDEDVKREAVHYGAFAFLDKPLYQRKVFSVIKRATKHR